MSTEDQMANPLAVGTIDEQLAIAKEHIEALVVDHVKILNIFLSQFFFQILETLHSSLAN